jgi:hypothetical protein
MNKREKEWKTFKNAREREGEKKKETNNEKQWKTEKKYLKNDET